jgi:peptidyl-prolyl cis-trans isomerase SurA
MTIAGRSKEDAMSYQKGKPPCRHIVPIILAAVIVAIGYSSAAAQQVVVRVNGDPVTEIDIAQRTKLIQISTHKTATRQEVLDELIDEKLKLHIAKRYKLEITDKEVDTAFNNIAQRSGSSPEKFAQALSAQGVSPEMVKARIRADMGWGQIVRGKFQSNFQIRDRDILDTLQRKDDPPSVGHDYTLRPILLIVQRGSPEAVVAARQREAEGLRTRFQNCEEGIRLARGLKDVAIRDPVFRSSADLTKQLREILDNTQEGRLTPPEITQQGIELYALCGKRQSTTELPGKREVREQLMQERFAEQGKRYLKELRAGAMIEYR